MLSLNNIGYSVKDRILLQDVNIAVKPATFTAVMGANGAGKSTLLKILSGDLIHQTGNLIWNNIPLREYDNKDLSRRRSVLRQQYNVQLPFLARQIIEMGRYPHFDGRLTEHCRMIINQVANYVGVDALMDRNYLTLSGGEQQRVQLARVLVQVWDAPAGEKLILLDEPVSALDIHFQHQLLALVKALTERGFTILAVLHDLNLAMQYADEVLMMKRGKVIAFGNKLAVMNTKNIKETFDVDVALYQHEVSDNPYIVVKQQNKLINSEKEYLYVNSDYVIEGKI
jgi:iron complex transport system ATP-binding protein